MTATEAQRKHNALDGSNLETVILAWRDAERECVALRQELEDLRSGIDKGTDES